MASLNISSTRANRGTHHRKRKKNVEVDEMGDLRGRIHVGKQDLGKLQTRKMKGLKPGRDEAVGDEEDEGEYGGDSDGEEGGRSWKRRRAA